MQLKVDPCIKRYYSLLDSGLQLKVDSGLQLKAMHWCTWCRSDVTLIFLELSTLEAAVFPLNIIIITAIIIKNVLKHLQIKIT